MTDRCDAEITLNQIRSFVETARRGSLTAAAEALDLSQPTIWKQVHELERLLGVSLIRTGRRGCELTAEGEILERLAAPSIVNVLNLPSRFRAAIADAVVPIRIAASPRPLSEEVVPCIPKFLEHHPSVRFGLIEAPAEEVPSLVDEGTVQLGFTLITAQVRSKFPLLSVEPWYRLDVMLVMHRKHPLARKRSIALKDLKPYPLIGTRSMLDELPGSEQIMALELDQNEPRWVEARHSAVVRSCVRQQLGIALLLGTDGQQKHPDLIERNMTPYLGQATMYLIHRTGIIHPPAVMEFAQTIRDARKS
jgi:DNA-binding transcriptional LysR family regulator